MRNRLTTLMLGVVMGVAAAVSPIAARQAAHPEQYVGMFPLDPSAEVVMTASFEGATAKGTWSLRAKGQTDEIVGGGIAISKK